MNENLITVVKDLISKGQTDQAIEFLLSEDLTKNNKEVLLISSRFKEFKRNTRLNLINNENKNIELAQINNSILDLLDSPLNKIPNRILKQKSNRPKSNIAQIVLASCAVITLILTGIYGLNSSSNQSNSTPLDNDLQKDETNYTFDEDKVHSSITYQDSLDQMNQPNEIITSEELPTKNNLTSNIQDDKIGTNESNLDYGIKYDIPEGDFQSTFKRLQSNLAKSTSRDEIESSEKELEILNEIGEKGFDEVWFSFPGNLIMTKLDGFEGLYTKEGKELFEPQFDSIDPVNFGNLYCTEINGKFGFIDQEGKELFRPKFDEISPLVLEHLYCTTLGNSYGFIDRRGIEIFPPLFSKVDFVDFVPLVLVKKNGKIGFLSGKGKIIYKFVLDSAERVWENTIVVSKDGAWGVIDFKGRNKIEFKYDFVEYIQESNSIQAKKNGKYYYFTDKGKSIKSSN